MFRLNKQRPANHRVDVARGGRRLDVPGLPDGFLQAGHAQSVFSADRAGRIFLGRYSAGILAVFAVIATSFVCAIQLNDFSTYASPLAIGLSVTL